MTVSGAKRCVRWRMIRAVGSGPAGARWGGKLASASGRFVDSLLGLRGRPFTRALTILGLEFGRLVPEVWDWRWLFAQGPTGRATVERAVRAKAADLERQAALAMFNLPPDATAEQIRRAWRVTALRWHPDRAHGDDERLRHQLNFIAYRAAYQRLRG